MKSEIVHILKNEVMIDTVVISEMLEVKHAFLLRTVEGLIKRQKNKLLTSNLKFPQKFIPTTFQNRMNRTYTKYILNEQAYMKLAMHLKGYEKAEIVQDAIIEAFSLMKEALLNQSNQSWLSARKEGKAIRTKETDVIKEFIEYATEQGSSSAFRYYSNITKMTNKALEFLVQTDSGSDLRDLAGIMELGYIQMLDNRAMQAIEYGMAENMPYKDIYKLAKDEVNELSDSLNFNRKKLK